MNLDFTSRRKLAKQLRQMLEDEDEHIRVEHFVQKQPYTMAQVVYINSSPGSINYYLSETKGVGFSKVQYPDRYDATVGATKAIQRALDDLADNLNDEVPF